MSDDFVITEGPRPPSRSSTLCEIPRSRSATRLPQPGSRACRSRMPFARCRWRASRSHSCSASSSDAGAKRRRPQCSLWHPSDLTAEMHAKMATPSTAKGTSAA